MPIRVIVADDHPVIRDGVRAVINSRAPDIQIIAEASNGQELLEMAHAFSCDVFVIDITMPVLNGLDTLRRLLRHLPEAKVIILSVHQAQEYVESALQSGAKGYVLKDETTSGLLNAIREVHQGRFYLSPQVTNFIIEGFVSQAHFPRAANGLTQREREVLQRIAEGESTKEIAVQLGISAHTVTTHRRNIMAKLNIHKHADLVRYAIKAGITTP